MAIMAIRRPAARQSSSPAERRRSFTATEAKNEFGQLLEMAIQGDAVLITKHDAPRAVMISIEEYRALKDAPERALNSLAADFDAMYERMQAPASRAAMKTGFSATPKQMGKAAVTAARKRG
jgi:antitoxin Phd